MEKIIDILNEIGINTKKLKEEDCLDIDSISIIELVLKIEENYSIKIIQKDVVFENFSSIKNISRLLSKYNIEEVNLKKDSDDINFYI